MMFYGGTLEIISLSFVAVGTLVALINAVLSLVTLGKIGSHGRRTKRWLRISAVFFFIYLAIILGTYVALNTATRTRYGTPNYNFNLYELNVISTVIGYFSLSAILHAQLKLTFDLYDKDNATNRSKALGLFMSPQSLNLIYFVVAHVLLYAQNLSQKGMITASNATSITAMLMPVFIWLASVISLVFTLIYRARAHVPVSNTAAGCLLAANILSVIRHTWSAILSIMYYAASRGATDILWGFPDYFDVISTAITVWLAVICVMLLIIGSLKGLQGRGAWQDEYAYGYAAPAHPSPGQIPIYEHNYGRAY